MSKSFLLDENNNIKLVNNNFAFTTPEQYVTQKIKLILQGFQGEWFLDANMGIPYYTEILGKNKSLSNIEAIFIREITAIPEVLEILDFTMDLDTTERNLSISVEVRDNLNNVLNVEVSI